VLQSEPGATSRNRLPQTRDAVTDPYVTVETVEPTGSIGQHIPVLKIVQLQMPVYVDCQKGSTEGIAFRMLDDDGTKDDILLEITLARDDFPDMVSIQTAEWKTFVKTSTVVKPSFDFIFKVMVSTVPLVWSPRTDRGAVSGFRTDSPILKR
jgi:hypothetical protein